MILVVMFVVLAGHVTPGATPVEVMTAGFGSQSSCASWAKDRSQGSIWILGYWSGRNVEAQKSVGGTSDADGILEEVRLICKAAPSRAMIEAVDEVYNRLLEDGR